MESQLWLFISGRQLPESTTGPCAAEVLLQNSIKDPLKSSQKPSDVEGQRLGRISSSPWVILPDCDQPLMCFLLSCCQGSDLEPLPLHMFSSVAPESSDSFCAQEELLQEALECLGSARGSSGLARDKMPCFCSQGIILCRKLKTQNGKPNFRYFL